MGNGHLKRLAAPKTWNILRKNTTFITQASPGPHGLESGMPLSLLIKDVLNYASTTREVKKIINTNDIRVDGKIRKDFRFPVGIFDTIEFSNTKEHFRVILNKKGSLSLVKIGKEESGTKPCKITGKSAIKGKTQLNFYDGKNILIGAGQYRVGDSILLSLPDQKIIKHLKFEKKSSIFLTGGKHRGEIGNVEDIVENKIIYKDQKGNLIETSKKYAFVVGDSKPLITLE